MPFEFEQVTLPLSAIASGETPFRITTDTDIQDLSTSIKRVGIINPPVLLSDGEGQFGIVCGHRRTEAAGALGMGELPARILPPDTPLLFCAQLAISENIIERPLNHLEIARALVLLDTHARNRSEFNEIAGEIGLPHTPSIVKKMMALCRLPAALQQAIRSGALALPSAALLSRFPQDVAVLICDVVVTLRLSLHKQREIIGLIDEIAINEEISHESLLTSPPLQEILQTPEMDTPRKAGLVRRYLKTRRYPHLSAAQEAFDDMKSRLKLGENATLTPPAGFESNRYSLSFTFASISDIERHERTLSHLKENAELIRLLGDRTP